MQDRVWEGKGCFAVCIVVGIQSVGQNTSRPACNGCGQALSRGFLTPLSASQVPRAVPPRGCGAVPVRCSRTGWGRPGAGCVDSRGTGVHALLARRCRVARATLCRGWTQCGAGRFHGFVTHRCKRPPPSENRCSLPMLHYPWLVCTRTRIPVLSWMCGL